MRVPCGQELALFSPLVLDLPAAGEGLLYDSPEFVPLNFQKKTLVFIPDTRYAPPGIVGITVSPSIEQSRRHDLVHEIVLNTCGFPLEVSYFHEVSVGIVAVASAISEGIYDSHSGAKL